MPRHAAPRRVPPGTPPAMSRTAWRRVRTGLTAGIFTVATVAGVAVGLSGTSVSPVAPAATIVASDAAPAASEVSEPVGVTRPDEGPGGRGPRGGGRGR